MNIEALSARLRPRDPWEAADLGVAMVRRYVLPVYAAFFVTVVPVCVGLFFLSPTYAVFWIWWVLPLFDRVPLFVLSRALFGDVPGPVRVLRELPRIWSRFLLIPLTIGRFSPWRSFHLPVSELEGMRGDSYFKRCSVLRQQQGTAAVGLIGMAGSVWFAVVFGSLFLIASFMPDGWIPSDEDEFEVWLTRDSTLIIHVVTAVALIMLEPFYVGAGFALYLNRRQQLEGWDIELSFRKIAKRITALRTGVRRKAGTLLGVLMCGCLAVGLAGQEPRPAPNPQDPQQVIQEVKAGKDFGYETTRSGWVPLERAGTDRASFRGLGGVLQVLAWVVLAVLIIGGIVLIVRGQRSGSFREPPSTGPPPAEVMGLDVRPDSLPENPGAEAWRLWQAGDHVGCLSLLYRGALAHLIHDGGLAIRRSSTEADCVELVENGGVEAAPYFRRLTRTWQGCAYAHRFPQAVVAESLCDEWQARFGGEG